MYKMKREREDVVVYIANGDLIEIIIDNGANKRQSDPLNCPLGVLSYKISILGRGVIRA
jgi:hypothetical protein